MMVLKTSKTFLKFLSKYAKEMQFQNIRII